MGFGSLLAIYDFREQPSKTKKKEFLAQFLIKKIDFNFKFLFSYIYKLRMCCLKKGYTLEGVIKSNQYHL